MRNSFYTVVSLTLLLSACSEPFEPTPIESIDASAKSWIGKSHIATPINAAVPKHPFMAPQGVNSMHSDGYSSDAHPTGGPLGVNTKMNSRVGSVLPGGQCATLTFDSNGDLLGLCASIAGFSIHRLRARTLELLAEYDLPTRPSSYEAIVYRDRSRIMHDSSGAYFYLDQDNRIVMADADKVVHRIASRESKDGNWEFYTDSSWDLSDHVPNDCLRPSNWFPNGECDLITAVMPDFSGLLWWATRGGRVGTINQETGEITAMQLNGEEIQNGFSVAEDGVYIVSDHAMYGFSADENGEPVQRWREPYDRGTSHKVGSINQGSGTTPTLLGSDYVTVTDNADGRINLLVYKRLGDSTSMPDRLICKTPVFADGHSATDNSMVAIGRSIVLENNAGFSNAMDQTDWSNAGGGLVRVDIREDESGCDVVWESAERSPSVVPKLSLKNGVVYFYTYERVPMLNPQSDAHEINAWYVIGLDYQTGETLFKLHTGNGQNYDNNWSPITIAPDDTLYVGTTKGIVAIWDE